MDAWDSAAVPVGVRRPWQVLEDDLEEKLAAPPGGGTGGPAARRLKAAVAARGARAALDGLPLWQRQAYAKVSMMELAAFARWRAAEVEKGAPQPDEAALAATWADIPPSDKAQWVPREDAAAALAAADPDRRWAPLLVAQAVAAAAPTDKGAQVEVDAPQGGEGPSQDAGPVLKWDEKDVRCEFKFRRPTGEVIQFQATLHAAGGSREAVENICRLCHARLREGALKCEAIAYRDELYRQVQSGKALPVQAPLALAAAPSSAPGQRPLKRKAPVAALLPKNADVMTASCCVCGGREATESNDLGLCDRCDKGFHQRCHRPRIQSFGRPEDPWFCAACSKTLVAAQRLRLREGDFAWAALLPTGRCPPEASRSARAALAVSDLWWPARVAKVELALQPSPKPYAVRLFKRRLAHPLKLAVEHLLPWAEGPLLHGTGDSRLLSAVNAAVASGAPGTWGVAGGAHSSTAAAPCSSTPSPPKAPAQSVALSASAVKQRPTPARRRGGPSAGAAAPAKPPVVVDLAENADACAGEP